MRAQASLELFFVFSVLLLLMLWLANYLNLLTKSSSSLYNQEKLLANGLVLLANRVCVSETEVTYRLPCIIHENRPVVYSIKTEGNKVKINSLVYDVSADGSAACNLDADVFSGCLDQRVNDAGEVCIKKVGTVKFSMGSC
ncbi:hypothetical protein HY991_02135 [Candidatus Micrarchaeota archaeon]|nr:hypothetical protein [Candidatus Micrarchaeota archaeon]